MDKSYNNSIAEMYRGVISMNYISSWDRTAMVNVILRRNDLTEGCQSILAPLPNWQIRLGSLIQAHPDTGTG